MKAKVVVVVPCFNESKLIGQVVRGCQKYANQVIVADDRSTDSTVLEAWNAGASVVRWHDLPSSVRGAGVNTWRGLRGIQQPENTIFVAVDGDGQHDPEDIPELIKPILEGRADFVIGTRWSRKAEAPWQRMAGNKINAFLCNLGVPREQWLTDTTCGMRAFTLRFVNQVEFEEPGFAFVTETIMKARKKGIRTVEVPIRCIYWGETKQNSSMGSIRHAGISLWAIIKWRVKLWV